MDNGHDDFSSIQNARMNRILFVENGFQCTVRKKKKKLFKRRIMFITRILECIC